MKRFVGIVAFSILANSLAASRDEPPEVLILNFDRETFEANHPERSKEYWLGALSKISIGMTQAEVLKILSPSRMYCSSTLTGGAHCDIFDLDKVWSISICFDQSSNQVGKGDRSLDKVLGAPVLLAGGWLKYFEKRETSNQPSKPTPVSVSAESAQTSVD